MTFSYAEVKSTSTDLEHSPRSVVTVIFYCWIKHSSFSSLCDWENHGTTVEYSIMCNLYPVQKLEKYNSFVYNISGINKTISHSGYTLENQQNLSSHLFSRLNSLVSYITFNIWIKTYTKVKKQLTDCCI